jgi:hypothetical protein
VAVDKQGSGMVVWRQFLSSSRILESHRPAGKSWTKPVTISNTSRTSYDPDVALDARGSAVAVWQVRISTDDLPRLEVHTASRPSGGAWGTSSRLDPDGLEPKIAMDGQGNATAVWYNVSPEYPYGLSGADKPAGKSWTTPREISSGHLSEEVDLAVGTSGTAAAVVRAYNADEEPTDLPLYAVVRD